MTLPINTPEREAREHQRHGVYSATVTDVEDPEQRGRVKVKVPAIHPQGALPTWALPLGASLGGGTGALIPPKVGAAVFVMFLDGNPELPLWIPGPFSTENRPPALQQQGARALYRSDRRAELTEKPNGDIELRVDRDARVSLTVRGGSVEISADGGKVVLQGGTSGEGIARNGDPVQVQIPMGTSFAGTIPGIGAVTFTTTAPVTCNGQISGASSKAFSG